MYFINFHIDILRLTVLSKRQNKWDFFSYFVAFSQCRYFNFQIWCPGYTKHKYTTFALLIYSTTSMPAAYYIVGLGLLNKAPGILQQITIHWALHTMVRSNNISSGEKFAPLNICQNIKEYTKLLVDEILVERNYVPCMILSLPTSYMFPCSNCKPNSQKDKWGEIGC